MNRQEPDPSAPDPVFAYQGAGLCLAEVDLKIGPFSVPTYPGASFGHAVSFGTDASTGASQIQLRPSKHVFAQDPPSNQFAMGYQQNGIDWEMIFRITSDPAGGLVGAAFALDAQSNYPDIPMSIAKIEINQRAFGALVQGHLPADYCAQLTTRFWSNGRDDKLALDAWLMLEVGYIPDEARRLKFARVEDIPLIPIGQVVLFPAHQAGQGGVIGDNYPSQVRSGAG